MSINKSDLAAKILNSVNKKKITNTELDGILENYIINKASEEESIYLAKHGFSVIECMESLLLDRKYSKETKMKKVKESSASADFIMKHATDIEEAKKNINSLRKMMPQLPEAFFAEWEEDPKDPLKKCDDEIADYIMSMSMLPDRDIDIDRLFNVTDKNYIKNGTERHFIFDHIKAFKNYIENYMKNHDILGEIDNGPLHESSDLANFIMANKEALEEANENINKIRKILKVMPEGFFAEWEEDPKDPLKKCDEDIANYVMDIGMKPNYEFDIDKLFNVADENYYSNGTERQFIFEHIRRLKNYLVDYVKNHESLFKDGTYPLTESKIKESDENIYPEGFSSDYGWSKCVDATDGDEGIAYIVADVLMHKMSFEDACENQNYYGDRKDIVRDRNIARKALKKLGYKGSLNYFDEKDTDSLNEAKNKIKYTKGQKEIISKIEDNLNELGVSPYDINIKFEDQSTNIAYNDWGSLSLEVQAGSSAKREIRKAISFLHLNIIEIYKVDYGNTHEYNVRIEKPASLKDPRIKVKSKKSLKENAFSDTDYTTSLWDIIDKINSVKRRFGDKKALLEAYDVIYAEIRKEMGE